MCARRFERWWEARKEKQKAESRKQKLGLKSKQKAESRKQKLGLFKTESRKWKAEIMKGRLPLIPRNAEIEKDES
jgi:hypothetical protein